MKRILFITMITLAVVFSSCKKDFDELQTTPDTMEQLKVPSNFDWKTTKDVSINFAAGSNGIVEVTNGNGIAYQKAFLQADASYTMILTIPSYEKSLIAKFKGQEESIVLDSERINIQF